MLLLAGKSRSFSLLVFYFRNRKNESSRDVPASANYFWNLSKIQNLRDEGNLDIITNILHLISYLFKKVEAMILDKMKKNMLRI